MVKGEIKEEAMEGEGQDGVEKGVGKVAEGTGLAKKKVSAKVLIGAVLIVLVGAGLGLWAGIVALNGEKKEESVADVAKICDLPKPEVTGGARGELGIDKNVNEMTLDEYLGCEDAVYRDMRMLEDPGNYEAIGGDRYLSGFVSGFEVVPLPYLMPVAGLPEEVGKTYEGKTLFSVNEEGKYVANYREAMTIMEELFPKDKKILLMCGGGGYAGMAKQLLVGLGWDEEKIWNVGGYWYYDGENKVEVKKVDEEGKTKYDFDLVNYHEIKFDELTEEKAEVGEVAASAGAGNDEGGAEKKAIRLTEKYYSSEGTKEYDEISLAKVYDEIEGTGKTLEQYNEEKAVEKAKVINEAIARKESFIVSVHSYEEACRTYGADGNFNLDEGASSKYFDYDRERDEWADEGVVYAYEANWLIFKKTKLYGVVKYAPTVVVVKNGEVYAYIDNNKDNIKSDDELEGWIKRYVEV